MSYLHRFFLRLFASTARFLSILVFLSYSTKTLAQPTFTANDHVTPYAGEFRAGYNPGYFSGWNDQTLGDLAAGVGTKTVRQGLFYELLHTWGYGVRIAEFQHFESLGMAESIGLILGGANGGSQPAPPDDVRDLTEYCPGHPSDLFKNLYLPIWDSGANGTPYNDQNYFAAYLWETVNTNKNHVRFWEIWNEPGFDYTYDKGWRPPGDPAGNWWDNNPDPCDYRLRAPIFHYVRMLRIAWEVVKTLSPDSYVCLSSPGYQSFLDAVMRNTDNQDAGKVTADYPLKGGAYFDCIAYHSYPHFDGSTVIDPTPPKKYQRTSDQAANGVVWKRDYFDDVLKKWGYDGTTFPKKEFIVSEINLPRKSFGTPSYFGSDEAQRNFATKAFVNAKINKIHQLHFFTLSELKKETDAFYEFDVMGLYKNISDVPLANIQKTEEGVALQTTSAMLTGTTYDPDFSQKLQQNGLRAEAFLKPNGQYVVVLWAVASTDLSETAAANFKFPANNEVIGDVYNWDFAVTNSKQSYAGGQLALTAAPVFVVGNRKTVAVSQPENDHLSVAIFPNPTDATGFDLRFSLQKTTPVLVELTAANGENSTILLSKSFENGDHQVHFNLEGQPSGIYFLSVKTATETKVIRLTKAK